jgi:hypothetical protein
LVVGWYVPELRTYVAKDESLYSNMTGYAPDLSRTELTSFEVAGFPFEKRN